MARVSIQTKPILPRPFFKRYTGVAVLVDVNTRVHCYERIRSQLPPHQLIVILPGEMHKNLDSCRQVWDKMTQAKLDRESLLVALGGGMVGDLGGFCASTYKRGVDAVLIPTTLLSMADASIGGKTGIDLGPLKNHIGTFSPPVATWIATQFLETLPEPELRSGFAEVIKHTLIGNRALWNDLRKKDLMEQDFGRLIKQSVAFKSAIVRKDPRESGPRKILNFGHTLGHAVEGYYLAKGVPVMHGDAVAAGMVMESHIARQKKLITVPELEQVATYILRIFGKVTLPDPGVLMPAMYQDKKNKGNKLMMALPKGIGKAVFDVPVSEQAVRDAVGYYRSYQT
jgi:3-dehydroquinate synthase